MSRINLEDPIIERPYFKAAPKNTITILPDANATLDADMGPIIFLTPSVSRTLTLPTASAALKGTTFMIMNAAAFTLVVRTGTPTTVATIPATVGATGFFVCLGATTAGGVEGWTGGL